MRRLLKDRRALYFVLSIVMVCVFALTVAYAALNTVLKINGNAEVSAASWDIYLDNVQLVGGSATTTVPTITNKMTASFTTTLTNPGDYYMFTIDVVNNGSIDAMIDNITKTPTLSATQAKYLNYVVEYENGESINTKQLVEANSFVRLKVKLEFRKDLVASNLPTQTETLNLSFTVKYTQSDDSDSNVLIDYNGKLIKVVKGDGTNTSDEICIGEECFYVISSTEEEIKMLAKYNLHVGNKYDGSSTVPLENPTGIQDATAKGNFSGYSEENPIIGTKPFSSTAYWSSITSTYPAYVYNENSYQYGYVENYKSYLEELGLSINEVRVITIQELESLGCSRLNYSCSGAPEWVYGTSYWSGTANSSTDMWYVYSSGYFGVDNCSNKFHGVRPVIVISRNLL